MYWESHKCLKFNNTELQIILDMHIQMLIKGGVHPGHQVAILEVWRVILYEAIDVQTFRTVTKVALFTTF